MDLFIQIDEPFFEYVNPEPIKAAIQTTLQLQNRQAASARSITVIITTEQAIQQLNHQYRGINAPTDVLSFENSPDPDFPQVEPSMSQQLGDIVIAYSIARAQAEASGHSPMDEIILLTVHGTLHLLGFDHDTPGNKERMWSVQHQIMSRLGLAYVQPTEH